MIYSTKCDKYEDCIKKACSFNAINAESRHIPIFNTRSINDKLIGKGSFSNVFLTC